ncbi:MAG: hypothetical protein HY049_01260 [Acidobacteria bacterium]|nr:hypothetical protein [Acidobacteriota bacterium]
MSQRPGRIAFPEASMISAPAGMETLESAPTAVMRCPEITTVECGVNFPEAGSKRSPFLSTSTPAGTRRTRFAASPRRFVAYPVWAARSFSTALSHPSRTIVRYELPWKKT